MPLSNPENLSQIIGLATQRSRFCKPRDYVQFQQAAQLGKSLIEIAEIFAESEPNFSKILNDQELISQCKLDLEKWAAMKIQILCAGSDLFPEQLLQIHKPPILLFVLGDEKALCTHADNLAIVGSRKADNFGISIAEEMSQVASASGVCVVSGLAYGIDAAAHRAALITKNTFPTVAVLGNGLGQIYPSRHRSLALEILAKGGCVISQFEPEMPPLPANFLNRNRVIAGLSLATLVIQAPERSGSLNTARYALEEGREVLVVPGSIHDDRYRGGNSLIKAGAQVILTPQNVLEYFPNSQTVEKEETKEKVLPKLEANIVEIVRSNGQVHIDQLKSELGDGSDISQMLLALELDGYLKRLPGNFLALARVL